MADNRKLAQGLMMMTPAMREDLAGREQDIQRGKTVELLRRAGKEMYENPIVNTAVGLSPVLGDIQAGVEAYRSAQAGDWGNAGLNAAGMLPFIPMLGKTVWHGSPHTFDKFDLSKIGTGEGAQAYGHGLYLADAPEVAKEYRTVGGKGDLVRFEENVYPITSEQGQMLSDVQKMGRKMAIEKYPNQADFIKTINPDNIKYEGGSLYKVDLPDEQIAKMLDWDKPLSEQPQAVQDALHQAALVNFETNIGPKASGEIGDLGWTKNVKSMSGEDLYRKLTEGAFTDEMFLQGAKKGEAQAVISEKLRQAGIPGIQYLDQASRGAGDGTRNYVVFSDEIPQILERNGTPLGNAVRNFEAPQAQALREAEEYGQKMLGLPPGNTPMERAAAGGYVDPTYHGTKTDVPEFDLSYHGTATDPGDFGEALYSSANPNIAGNYAETTMRGATTEGANIMPLMTRQGNQMQVEGMKGMEPLLEKAGGIENWFDLNPQQQAQIAKDMGYTSVRDFGYPQTANYDLGDVRSKFAAFDPRYFGKPGLMLGAGGLGIYGALQGEDEYK